jgi:excisionase family DNA binding protein
MSITELLTIREVAASLNQHPNTVRRHIAEGRLGAVRLGTGPRSVLRVPADALERFLAPTEPTEREAA